MSFAEVLGAVERLGPVKKVGKEHRGLCPVHGDKSPSLEFHEADDASVVVQCRSQKCSFKAIAAALGLPESAFFPPRRPAADMPSKITPYSYTDEQGNELSQSVRKDLFNGKKTFYQRHRGPDGEWINNAEGVRRVLYGLPELRVANQGEPVWVVAGEKCVAIMRGHGFVATTNIGGEGHWTAEDSEFLRGRDVVVFPDADEVGHKHGQQVAAALQGIARSVRVVDVLGLPLKGDCEQYFSAGHTAKELRELAANTKEWTPQASATPTEAAPEIVIPPRISDDAVAVWSKPLPPAIPTPFAPLNRLLGDGLSGLTTLVAPTGVGKTGLALLLGRHAAQSMPVLYVSTELGIRQSYARIAGQILRRPWYPLFRGAALTGQVVASAAAGLDFRCLVFTSLTETLATADAIVAHDGKAPFVILDFLQGAARDATVDRRAAVSAACDAMLQWCRVDEGRVALMVSSTARAHYATDDRVARDLVGTAKESGDVEFAATAVLSLRTEECPLDGSTVGQIHVAKSRFGTVGIVGVVFEGATGEFRCDERQSLSEIERAAYDAIAAGAETKDAVRLKLKGSNEAKTAAVRSLRMRGLISTNPYRVIHVSDATETASNDIEQRRTHGPDADPPPKQVTFTDGERGSGPGRPRTGSTVRVRPPIGADTDPPESPECGNPNVEGEVS